MTDTVYIKTYSPPKVSLKEVMRYLGQGQNESAVYDYVEECLGEVQNALSYKVCYRIFDLAEYEEHLDLGFAKVGSRDLRRNLKGCEKIILFGATVGLGIDKLIAKYSIISPTKALIFDAIGTERIEALADAFNEDIKKQTQEKGYFTKPRFSAGYGDLPLELQKDIFTALDCGRKIGLTLCDSFIMSPTKSVTAIIGITKKP